MRTKLQKINEGFTIVEVLIVLAIAALILTIILIAVPDLQRSARNSDILHDAQNVASAIQTYEGNNQGGLPSLPAGVLPEQGPTIKIGAVTTGSGGSASAAVATAKVQSSDLVQFVNVTPGTVKFTTPSPTSGTAVGVGYIVVAIGFNCNGTSPASATGSTLTAGTNDRAVAVYYPIEAAGATNGGNVGCIQE